MTATTTRSSLLPQAATRASTNTEKLKISFAHLSRNLQLVISLTRPHPSVSSVVDPLLISIASAAEILLDTVVDFINGSRAASSRGVKDGARTKITFESAKRVAAALPKAQLKLYVPKKRLDGATK